MKKRILILSILGIILFSIFMGSFIFYDANRTIRHDIQILNESLKLIKDGRYEEGLERCDQMYNNNQICYVTYFGIKRSHSETWDTSICERIVPGRTRFWLQEDYLEKVNESKAMCYKG